VVSERMPEALWQSSISSGLEHCPFEASV